MHEPVFVVQVPPVRLFSGTVLLPGGDLKQFPFLNSLFAGILNYCSIRFAESENPVPSMVKVFLFSEGSGGKLQDNSMSQ